MTASVYCNEYKLKSKNGGGLGMRLPYMTYFDNLILEAISNPSATTVEHVLRDHMCQGGG